MFTEKKFEAVKEASHLLAENLVAINGDISVVTSKLVGDFGCACQEYGSRVGFIDGFGWGFTAGAGIFVAGFLAVNVIPEFIAERKARKEADS